MGLMYKGHMFDGALPACTCCVGDARMVADDPTGTRKIRTDMFRATSIKWRQVKSMAREMIVTMDFLQLKSGGLMNPNAQAVVGGATKVQMFQRWFDAVLDKIVLESTGSFLGPYVNRAYAAGQQFGQDVVGVPFVNVNARQREDTIRALAVVELQGVMEAVSQQAVRAVANGLLTNASPLQIVRAVWEKIDKIGVVRSRTLVELIVVKAFGDATLDVYAALGVQEVGLIPEVRIMQGITDAAKKRIIKKKRIIAKKRLPEPKASKGAGSRASRKSTPSASTIGRITSQEERLEKLGLVRVRTAGDENVCPVCLKIAKNGPYKIDKARSLIPAHPRCRCIFIPANDKRFRENKIAAPTIIGRARRDAMPVIDNNGGNPYHDPKTGQFTTGPGGFEDEDITVDGEGDHLKDIREAVASIPDEHRKVIASQGVKVRGVKTIRAAQGLYKYQERHPFTGQLQREGPAGLITIASHETINRKKVPLLNVHASTVHELGHALDHATNWKLGKEMRAHIVKDMKGLTPDETAYAKHFFSNNQEAFAELYSATYAKHGTAFFLPRERALAVFANSIAAMKKLKVSK